MKTVLVSGGTSTLGRALCTRFVEEGYMVYCAYASSKEKAISLSASLGPSLIPLHLDVQDETSIAEGCSHLQSLDLLVNNSGVFSVFPTEELAVSEWQRIFDINVTGMFRLTKQVLTLLRQAKGSQSCQYQRPPSRLGRHHGLGCIQRCGGLLYQGTGSRACPGCTGQCRCPGPDRRPLSGQGPSLAPAL